MKFVKMERSLIETASSRNFADSISGQIQPCEIDATAFEPTRIYSFRNGRWVLEKTDC